jgi:hypothetical protein
MEGVRTVNGLLMVGYGVALRRDDKARMGGEGKVMRKKVAAGTGMLV